MKLMILILAVMAMMVPVIATSATAPEWVANTPGTGFLPCYDSAAGDASLSMIEVTATAELTFSCWSWNVTDGWDKMKPGYWEGVTAADSLITVEAGVTKTFKFPYPRLAAIFVVGGDGNWSGE